MLDEGKKLKRWREQNQRAAIEGAELIAWELEKLCREVADARAELKLLRQSNPPYSRHEKS